jgi:hypothetical protein
MRLLDLFCGAGSEQEITPKYFWLADIRQAQKQAQKPQLMLL